MTIETQLISSPRASSQSSRRPWHRIAMYGIRRLHLFSGLFMFPWVLLYGITAFLFNHSSAFPDRHLTYFGDLAIQGTKLEAMPTVRELAGKVIRALQQKVEKDPGQSKELSSIRLVEADQAGYKEEYVFARVVTDGQEHFVRVNVHTGSGRVSTRPIPRAAAKPPFAQESLTIEGSPPELVKESLDSLLDRLGLAKGEVTLLSGPDLSFLMEVQGDRWLASYNTLSGEVTGRPAGQKLEGDTLRSFLLNLHLSHGFPSSPQARWYWTRWFWAVGVDAMFVSMVFWGISGVLMFWQLKAVRRFGIVTLALSAVAALALALAMHGQLTQ